MLGSGGSWVGSGGGASFNGGSISNPLIIDATDTEALLIRKSGDTGDVFAVDSSGSIILLTAADIQWASGKAVTANSYSIVRDVDGTNQLHFNAPTGAGFEFSLNDVARFVLSPSNTTITQVASTSGNPTNFLYTGAAHTGLTASTQSIGFNVNLAATVQFATGALTAQRAMYVQAPTYGFVGASTITTASTLAISGGPIVGTNATFTNSYAIHIESGRMLHTAGVLGDQLIGHSYTATMPSSSTGRTDGAKFAVVSAGSDAVIQCAGYFSLTGSYTGASYSIAMQADNTAQGTATSYLTGACNLGSLFSTTGTTAGSNVGFRGNAGNGNMNFGAVGVAATAKNSATNVGMMGAGINTGSTPIQVGGFFQLGNGAPTFVSAALICDNSTQTDPIFIARDNGTAVFTITDGGNVCIGNSAAGASALKVLALSNSATAPSTSVDMVQLYAVDISAGNASLGIFTETAVVTETVTSDRTLTVKINGTDYKICLKV